MKPGKRWIHHWGQLLPWLALGCAFGPVLVRLARAIPGVPFGWSVLLAPVLLVRAGRLSRGRGEPRRGWAAAFIIAGLMAELIGLAGDSWAIATAGLPISVIGLALWIGTPPVVVAALACWVVPIPKTFFSLTTPHVESALAHLGALSGSLLGADVHASGPLLRSGGEQLQLDPYHNGLHLAVMASQLAWYAAARNGAPLMAAVRCAAGAAFAALPLQIPAVLVAVVLLVVGAPRLASAWLDCGVWMLTAILGIAWIENRLNRAPSGAQSQP